MILRKNAIHLTHINHAMLSKLISKTFIRYRLLCHNSQSACESVVC